MLKLIKICAVLINLILFVRCDNTTSKYLTANFRDRNSRFLTFNTQSDIIKIDLKFLVPFISIPIKDTWDFSQSSLANLNTGALVLTGLLVVVSSVFVPAFLKIFKFLPRSPFLGNTNYRSDEDTSWWRLLSIVDQVLAENNIDTTSCMQRMVCWTVKNSSFKVMNGTASSNDKILDGIVTNEWFGQFIEGTSIYSAIKTGVNRNNCLREYNHCKLNQWTLQNLIKQFSKFVNR